MPTILGISGSLRAGSYNTMLLRAAKRAAPAGTTIEEASIRDIPLYDGDVEERGMPPAVTALKQRVLAADAVLLVSPEYNNSVPGTLKNAIDWLSRPPADIRQVFGRPFGVIGASAGAGGTNLAQVAWLPVLRTLGAQLYVGERLAVATAQKVFDGNGELTDDKLRERLAKYLAGFARFVEHERRQ